MLDDLLGSLIGGSIGDAIGSAIKAPFIRAKQRRGKMRAALRLEWGAQEGVTTSWRRGNVRLHAGRIEFRGHEIVIVSVSEAPRSPSIGEWVRVHVDSVIYSVTTPTARLLWAVPGPQASWALNRIAQPSARGPAQADDT